MQKAKAAKAKVAKVNEHECSNCMAPGSSICGRCGVASYCSRECQKAHWKESHKDRCILIEDRKASKLEPQETSTRKCQICFDTISSETQSRLPCGHCFHAECVKTLRYYDHSCPLCRRDLPSEPEKLYILARTLYITNKDTKKMIKLLEQSIEQGYDSAKILLFTIYYYGDFIKQDYEKAEELLLLVDKKTYKIFINLASVQEFNHKYDEAIQSYLEASKFKCTDKMISFIHYSLANVYNKKKDITSSKKHFILAIQFDTTNANAHFNLGNIYFEEEDYKNAKNEYKLALIYDENNDKIHNNLGNVYLQLKEYTLAQGSFKRTLQINPRHKGANINLGLVLNTIGDLNGAEQRYLNEIKENPDSLGAHYNLGLTYVKTFEKLDLAIEQFELVLKLEPNYMGAHFEIGVIYLINSRLVKAKSKFMKVLELTPKNKEEESILIKASELFSNLIMIC